jgi:hypothetical protein
MFEEEELTGEDMSTSAQILYRSFTGGQKKKVHSGFRPSCVTGFPLRKDSPHGGQKGI